MMNKKFKGFSLAELLISLLIISIVLSAAIPTLTKKAGAGREFIWRWSQKNNSAYFGVGSNQSAIIGAESIPLEGQNLKNIFLDGEINLDNFKFSNNGDKLVLLKKSVFLGNGNTEESDFANSHISFYTAKNAGADATTSDIYYAGRIATGRHDLAFGIGTLQSLSGIDTNNTALGHYSLLRNTEGTQNTAVGEKALAYNATGSHNTAVGFKSLFKAGDTDDGGTSIETTDNTAIGFQSALAIKSGSGNSVMGADALPKMLKGDNNVVIGNKSMEILEDGSQNIAIGTESCKYMVHGSNNICLGNRSGAISQGENYGLFIGSSVEGDNDVPIISGHTQKHTNDKNALIEKELIINAKTFQIRPAYSGTSIMQVDSYAADSGEVLTADPGKGYGNGKGGYMGNIFFNLLHSGEDSTTISLRGTRTGTINEPNKRIVFGTFDFNQKTNNINEIDLSFNERLALVFRPNTSECSGNACINLIGGTSDQPMTNLGINRKLLINNESATPELTLDKAGFNLNGNKDNFAFKILGKSGSLNSNFKDSFNLTIGASSNYKLILSTDNDGQIFTTNFDINKDRVYLKSLINKITTKQINSPYYGQGKINLSAPATGELGGIINEIISQLNLTNTAVSSLNQNQSDARLKNISGDNTAGLKEINALEIKNYTFKADKNKTPHVGVIAQQLQKVFPNSVFKGEDGYLRITKDEIFYAMVNSIKELFKQIQDLTAKITGLDKRITELEKQNAQLKKQNAEFEKRLSKLERASR